MNRGRSARALYSDQDDGWRAKTLAEEKQLAARKGAELRGHLVADGRGTGTAGAQRAMRTRTSAQKSATMYDAGSFKPEYDDLAARTARREKVGRQRQAPTKTVKAARALTFYANEGAEGVARRAAKMQPARPRKHGLLYDAERHITPDTVALPVREGHGEDPRDASTQPRNFKGGKRDADGRLLSVGDGKNHSGHSEEPWESRRYKGRKRDRDGRFLNVGADNHAGFSEDDKADRLYRPDGTKAPRSDISDAFGVLYPKERF
jgi:hypothetical protein